VLVAVGGDVTVLKPDDGIVEPLDSDVVTGLLGELKVSVGRTRPELDERTAPLLYTGGEG